MPKEITAYTCSFCDKVYKLKSSAARHEKKCFANPANRACRSCSHAVKDRDTVYVPPHGDQNYGDADYEIDYIWCEINQQYLSHPDKPCGFEHHCKECKEGEKLF
jgi:hypothetical protein